MAAKAQGMKLADFIRVRILGELPEFSHTEALPDPDPRVLRNPGAKSLADIKAELGLKTAAEIEPGAEAIPPDTTKKDKVADRPFSLKYCRTWWVRPGYDMGLMRDSETLRFWPVVGTSPQSRKSFATEDEAKAALPD
jgi:hypothetical protein